MKISNNNVLAECLLYDNLGGAAPWYEIDPLNDETINVPTIIVDKDKQITKAKIRADNRIYVPTIEWNNEQEFNDAIIKSFITAAKENSHTVKAFKTAQEIFDRRNIVASKILISHQYNPNYDDVYKKHEEIYKVFGQWINIKHIPYHAPHYIFVLPDPEFLGVIPAKQNYINIALGSKSHKVKVETNIEYGIGIIASCNMIAVEV